MSSALGVLDGIARFDGDRWQLHNRVAEIDGAIYYDLADRKWSVVIVKHTGWRVEEDQPPVFRRYAHQAEQVRPVAGGDPYRIFDFLNVREADRLLLLAWVAAAFMPAIPHPILHFHGEKGAAKSTGQRVVRRLIDPSEAEGLGLPDDKAELVQQLSHHYCPIYDNIDYLSPSVSDLLCRAVTGDAFTKRELYSDDDDVIYSFRRVVMLNGINVAAQRADLLDRSILIELLRIERRSRRPEREFWIEFERAKPAILGAFLDLLP